MIGRRGFLGAAVATTTGLAATGRTGVARAEMPELRIGNTMPYSGPNSAYAPIGKTESAYCAWLNQQGGVGGHRINFMSVDDGYSPPRTLEVVRRLVEQENVTFLFNTLGTPTNSAIERYCNQHKVPQLFVATGADKWGDYKQFPWTMGLQPSYRTEAQIYAKYIIKQKPNAKVAFLYQNDDFGKDYLNGVRDIFGKDWDKYVIRSVSFEVTDPTINSQVASLQASGADTFVCAAGPKAAAQTIRRAYEVNWHPLFFMTNVSISVGAVMKPAGAEAGKGIITSGFLKDSTDPAWNDDPGMNEWRAFMARQMPGSDLTDSNYVYGFMASRVLHHVLQACNGDFTRENVLKQATSIASLEVPVLLPGIKVSTSPTNYHPIRAMQLQKWDGAKWVRFGEVIEGVES